MRIPVSFLFVTCLVLSTAALAKQDAEGPFDTEAGPVMVEPMVGPFVHPWGFVFLPESARILVTERGGDLRLVEGDRISEPLAGVPDVWARGQGGLLDVALDPDFSENNRIYLSYSEPVRDGARARTALATGILTKADGKPLLEEVEVLFRQEPAVSGGRHFGSRIVFDEEGKLYLTLGDRGNPDRVQDLSNHLGKVIRLERDGSIPADNPFVDHTGAKPEIWSYGHRNAQGAALRSSDKAYFTISHGAAGGDEVNRPIPGQNFGWPEVSYGTEYNGDSFPAQTREDVVPPLFYWDPSIAPSGAAFYEGDLIPEWQGDLFVGALRDRLISRLKVEGDQVVEVERLFPGDFGRIRDIRNGPDGALWFASAGSKAYIYRILPAE